MSEYILRTSGLTKKYKHTTALNNVNLSIKKGAIYGFIGQNGAGKSTFIKLVAGLAFASEGSIELFGEIDPKKLIEARKRVGTIIEGPALFPHMTAKQNLEVHRVQRGIPGNECIEKTLALVGLQHTGKKKTRNFSLGMKQRLGLAMALLSEPEFLILDEPINGLDPMGVVEIRELLLKLNREKGITILISSHILSELNLLATHYGIIHDGKLLEELTAKDLQEKCQQYLHIKVDKPHQGVAVLEEELGTKEFEVMPDGIIKLYKFVSEPGLVSTTLAANGAVIEQFMPMGEDLEEYFTKLIGGGNHE